MAQKIVVDANLCVSLIVPLGYSQAAAEKWIAWEADRASLYAPLLWEYEVVSAIRKAVFATWLNSSEAENALQRLFNLGIAVIPPDSELHRSALQWSDRIGQPVAYDGQYIALAEALQAELWTADKRLSKALSSLNLPWLHWIGEAT